MRSVLLAILCLGGTVLKGQERFGLLHSNYGGTDIAFLNPARSAGQWPWMDIRVAGADVFAWNSLVAWTGRPNPLVKEFSTGFANAGEGRVVLRSHDLAGMHRATVLANVLGPAVSVGLGRGTLGLGVRSRAFVSASGVSSALGNFIFHGLGYRPQHGTRYNETGLRVLGAAWSEAQVSYAHIVKAEGFGMLSAGLSARYLLGHGAGAFQITALDYTVHDTARLDVHEVTTNHGFAEPAGHAGSGWGADLGLVYERTLSEADGYRPHRGGGGCTPMRYRYRIGISLVDLGGIRFGNAQAGTITAGQLSIPDYTDMRVRGAEGVDSLLATATSWSRTSGMRIGLPTALSIQYDQRILDNAYIALAAVQNVAGRNSMRLRRGAAVSIAARFESRYVELAMPITVHEYELRSPSIGLMLRFHGIVLGSDHILTFFSRRDVHAADLYVRVRWMIFRSPACRNGRSGSITHRGKAKDMVPCTTPGVK